GVVHVVQVDGDGRGRGLARGAVVGDPDRQVEGRGRLVVEGGGVGDGGLAGRAVDGEGAVRVAADDGVAQRLAGVRVRRRRRPHGGAGGAVLVDAESLVADHRRLVHVGEVDGDRGGGVLHRRAVVGGPDRQGERGVRLEVEDR